MRHSTEEKIVEKLGGEISHDWESCTHLVTDKIRRTFKFLCCLSAGKYIMEIGWLDASKKSGAFIGTRVSRPIFTGSISDEANYTLSDHSSIYSKTMKRCLELNKHNGGEKLFQGYHVYATKSVQPPREHLAEILSAAGGKLLTQKPNSFMLDEKVIVVGTAADSKECGELTKLGFTIHDKEIILDSILTHDLNLNRYFFSFM